MDAKTFQELAARTLLTKPDCNLSDNDIMLIWNAIGLAGESGEVCENIKKSIFHQHGLNKEKLAEELGDVLWYAAALATRAGLDLNTIMEQNINKLKQRYPNGYTSEDSKNRSA